MPLFWSRDRLAEFEKRIGYRFRERAYLLRALTHRSFAHEQGLNENYERLEFLGDAVLGLVAARWLFTAQPGKAEGDLSAQKSVLVSERALAGEARELGLGEFLRVGVGEERTGGRDKKSLLADSLEAVIGAVFLDGGMRAADRCVLAMLERIAARTADFAVHDAKTRLQELAQARGWRVPRYHLVEASGPDHEKTFVVACRVGDLEPVTGEGRSKKRAEQEAAAALLATLQETDR